MKTIALAIILFVTGCVSEQKLNTEVEQPEKWSESQYKEVDPGSLKGWWKHFKDPVLNELVDLTLQNSPDRLIALSRINEARGILKSTRSSLFPQVNVTGTRGEADQDYGDRFGFYEAGFDASFEIDLFGKNSDKVEAEDSRLKSLEQQYQDVSVSLLAEVARVYVNIQSSRIQRSFTEENLKLQNETLELIKAQFSVGEGRQIDIERAENIVNLTKAKLHEFERLSNAYLLQLVTLTGELPKDLNSKVASSKSIPGVNLKPVLLSPVQVLSLRPDIRSAELELIANTLIKSSVSKEVLPDLTLRGFWGIADGALNSSAFVWQTALQSSMSLLDFGKIQGQIDSAASSEMRAFHNYRKAVLNAISEVETSVSDFTKINSERIFQEKARLNAYKAHQLSVDLFKEGEISFLDVLDTQRSLIDADSLLTDTQSSQAKSLIRIYKSLGVY